MTTEKAASAVNQQWLRQDDVTPHPLVQAVAHALAADHRDCDPESCCQRNSGPDWVEAHKALQAVNQDGYAVIEIEDLRELVASHDGGGCSYCSAGRADLCRDKVWLAPLRRLLDATV